MHAKNTKKVTVEPLVFENYLALIRSSENSPMFQHYYCLVNGKHTEVLDAGRLSCAIYVTSVLKIFSLVKDVQITVHRALDDMERSGWEKISEPKIGSIIVWGEVESEKDKKSRINAPVHRHIGFYLGEGQAISNSSQKRAPLIHKLDYRPIEYFLWHKNLA